MQGCPDCKPYFSLADVELFPRAKRAAHSGRACCRCQAATADALRRRRIDAADRPSPFHLQQLAAN